jgi:catechol 2,3-dioxygenase-like lactoylglutathione lyase family enzyme
MAAPGGAAVSRLNYLAIMCDDPTRMRDWYQRWLGLEEYHRTAQGSIYLTDGHFSVGLLARGQAPGEDDQEPGVHHLGFEIDSILEIERNLEEFDPSIRIEERPPEDPFAQYRIRDPEGIVIDLSERGYGVNGEPRIPGIRHLATINQDQPRKHAFYLQVFGMRDVTRTQEEIDQHTRETLGGAVPADFKPITVPAPFAGDGFVNLALLSNRNGTRPARNRPSWLDHFGMLVPDPLGLLMEIRAAEGIDGPMDVRPPERQVEYGVKDPEGNIMDLSSTKGWKVDVDRWARIG